MDAWDAQCKLDGNKSEFEKRTDGVRCPTCKTESVSLKDMGPETKRMICAAHAHTFWFVPSKEGCPKCTCKWIDSSQRQRQIRSADEGAHITICCMHGCTAILRT